MKIILPLSFLFLVLPYFGCGTVEQPPAPSVSSEPSSSSVPKEESPDRDTPEGAILALEEAYRNQDIEAAVRCKDFKLEARLMLEKLQPQLKDDPEILAKTVQLLEQGFRSEKTGEFPDFHGVKSTFSQPTPYEGRDDIVELIETCRLPNGRETQNKMVVANTADGWKVISVVD